MRNLAKLIRDHRGVTAIEYATIASLISVAALDAFQHMGNQVNAKFEAVNGAM